VGFNPSSRFTLRLLREVAQGATGDLRQVKGAQLVLFHHLLEDE